MSPFSGKNKIKIVATILVAGSFLFSAPSAVSAQTFLNSYSKPPRGTLSATEWNNLPLDFVNRNGLATMSGPLVIGSLATSSSLTVHGVMAGTINATNISSGEFGVNTGRGNFLFGATGLGNVGIGTVNPTSRLQVAGTITSAGLINSGPTRLTPFAGAGQVVVMADNSGNLFATTTSAIVPTQLWSGTLNGNIWNGGAGAGNVGIGTTAPGSRLTINGAVEHAGNPRYYRNVVSADIARWEGDLGTVMIRLPKSWSNTMMTMRIQGYDYSGIGAWEVIISGYNHTGGGGVWVNNDAEIRGSAPFNQVRLGHDGTRNVVLLGNTGTMWRLGAITVSEFIAAFHGQDGWGTGWSISRITSEVGITHITNIPIPMIISEAGNVGIGTTNPTRALEVRSTGAGLFVSGAGASPFSQNIAEFFYSGSGNSLIITQLLGQAGLTTGGASQPLYFSINKGNPQLAIAASGNVGIGTTNPTARFTVNGSTLLGGATQISALAGAGQVVVMADSSGNLFATSTAAIVGNFLPLSGGTMSGGINMGGNDITNINKLTVNTIDPLYRINGINYSTFAATIVGGVKEELIDRAEIRKRNSNGEYEFVIDFTKQKEGSDLWVWYKTIDFSRENVNVFMTNYGNFAQVYYLVEDEKIILRASEPTTVSYRLIARRHDWREWPTKALDQNETPGFIINEDEYIINNFR